jgi:hypothetical protein
MKRLGAALILTALAGTGVASAGAAPKNVAGGPVDLVITMEGLVALYSKPGQAGGAAHHAPNVEPVGTTWALFPRADDETQTHFTDSSIAFPETFSRGMHAMTSHYVAIRIPLKYVTGNPAQKGELLLDPLSADPFDPEPNGSRHPARLEFTASASQDAVQLVDFAQVPPVPKAGGDGKEPAIIDAAFLTDGSIDNLSRLAVQMKFVAGWKIEARQAQYVDQAGQLAPTKVRQCFYKSQTELADCSGNPDDHSSVFLVASTRVSTAPMLTIKAGGHSTDVPLTPIGGKVELTIQNAPAVAIIDNSSADEPGTQFEHSKLYYMLADNAGQQLAAPYYFPLRGGTFAPGRYCSSGARYLLPKE